MKTPLPLGPASRPRFARLDFKRIGIVLLILSAVARAVNAPTLVPDGGTFTTFQTVTVSCTTPDAIIRYTTNGADPTMADAGFASGGQIQVQGPVTLKVKAFLNIEESTLKTATYNITGHVSTSGNHTLILRADGTVWATGLNSSGQLGDGTTINRIVLTQVPGSGTFRRDRCWGRGKPQPGVDARRDRKGMGVEHELSVRNSRSCASHGDRTRQCREDCGRPHP